jgi:hypothetical protein
MEGKKEQREWPGAIKLLIMTIVAYLYPFCGKKLASEAEALTGREK